MADIIKTKSLSKHYKKIKALNNISLSIPKGSIFGILGPNGAGKTTLISILITLINGRFSNAAIIFIWHFFSNILITRFNHGNFIV